MIIRPLEQSEWEKFKELRLFALRTEPGMFCSTYAGEAAYDDQEWRDTISGHGNQVFGLFDGDRLVGLTAVYTNDDDASGSTATLAMSFIHPDYRGRGLARMLYDARLAWIKAQPHFKRITVSHRKSNDVSRKANQPHGFVQTGTRSRTWPDGITDDELLYELTLAE
jgi:RimJ/RimL family protein N-acetyltransferase